MPTPIEKRVDRLVTSETEKGRYVREVVVKGQEIRLVYGKKETRADDFDLVDFAK